MSDLPPIIQSVVTVAVLAAGLYALLVPSAPAVAKKWAPSAIALVTGYWLLATGYMGRDTAGEAP